MIPEHDPPERSTVRIERLVNGGAGLARTDAGVVFVRDALPGELVTIGPPSRDGGASTAPLIDIIEPSPHRVDPPCPVYGACGGCDWQHLAVAEQRRWKREIVAENLRRLGGISWDPERIGMVAGAPWGYRSRVQLHRSGGTVGFRRRRSRDVVEIDSCPVATTAINGEIRRERARRAELPDGRITIVASGAGVARSDRDREATLQIGDTALRFHPAGFAQANRELLPALGEALRGAVTGRVLVDLFAGAGLLARLATAGVPSPPRLVCVEPDRRNAALIRTNLQDVPDVRVHRMTAERAVARGVLRDVVGDETTVLLDPPRTGLSRSVRRWLTTVASARVAYLSCDAAALARDLSSLTPDYRIDEMTMFDFYPQTAHIETLVILSRKGRR